MKATLINSCHFAAIIAGCSFTIQRSTYIGEGVHTLDATQLLGIQHGICCKFVHVLFRFIGRIPLWVFDASTQLLTSKKQPGRVAHAPTRNNRRPRRL